MIDKSKITPPMTRIIREGTTKFCEKCGSSLKSKFFGFITTDKCIQPECDNYYMSDTEVRKSKIKSILK